MSLSIQKCNANQCPQISPSFTSRNKFDHSSEIPGYQVGALNKLSKRLGVAALILTIAGIFFHEQISNIVSMQWPK